MQKRKGDPMRTVSGKTFWPMDPIIDDIDIHDIAHSLSNQCRYAGHTAVFYSVAEHSVHIAQELNTAGYDKNTVAWGLLHDATEAYCTDVPRPIKKYLPDFIAIEEKLHEAISVRFGLSREIPAIVTSYDNRILANEMSFFWPNHKSSTPREPLPNITPACWSPGLSFRYFMEEFERIQNMLK